MSKPHDAHELNWTDEQAEAFWRLYADNAQPAIERACRSMSRIRTDNGMSTDDMVAWADDRVWTLQQKSGWPFFHDQPCSDFAADRITSSAKTLARWAYLALSRRHWRRKEREQAYMNSMGRTERLAMVSSSGHNLERNEDVKRSLEEVRARVNQKVRARLAASWPHTEDRKKIALALGATTPEDEALMQDVDEGRIAKNTIDQMRSRSRKEVRSILAKAKTLAIAIVAAAAVFMSADARAGSGEQSGGRNGAVVDASNAINPLIAGGEQTGGRGGRGG